MKIIENYQELSRLIFSCLKKNVVTNCFLSKEEWKQEISEKNVYYFMFGNNLFIFRKRENFWILNYYLNELESEEIGLEFEKNISDRVVVEIVSKSVEDLNYLKQQNFFSKLKMKKMLERERFQNVNSVRNDVEKIADVLIDEDKTVVVLTNDKKGNVQEILKNKTEVEILLAKEQFCREILNLFKNNFDLYYGCIPTEEKLKEDIKTQSLYIAKSADKVIGILHFKKTEKYAEIRHLAVEKSWRGKGIANCLMDFYEKQTAGIRKIVWTGANNQIAQGLYQKYKYEKDGYVSSVFMKETFTC